MSEPEPIYEVQLLDVLFALEHMAQAAMDTFARAVLRQSAKEIRSLRARVEHLESLLTKEDTDVNG